MCIRDRLIPSDAPFTLDPVPDGVEVALYDPAAPVPDDLLDADAAVSYTHLDVYKRQVYYHMTFHRRRFEKLDEVLHENGHERVYAERLSRMDDHLTQRLTTFVPCAEYFHVRDDALRAHATQIDPDGFWFAVPLAIQKLGWPTEDYQLCLLYTSRCV